MHLSSVLERYVLANSSRITHNIALGHHSRMANRNTRHTLVTGTAIVATCALNESYDLLTEFPVTGGHLMSKGRVCFYAVYDFYGPVATATKGNKSL